MNMPIIRPIPIVTKGESGLKKLYRWVTYIRKWELVEDWTYKYKDHDYIIHKGFVFDGASIPKPLWFLLSPTGLLLIPSLIHDFGYQNRFIFECSKESTGGFEKVHINAGRRFWDDLFLDVCNEVNDIKTLNFLCWIAIVLFGWISWNSRS